MPTSGGNISVMPRGVPLVCALVLLVLVLVLIFSRRLVDFLHNQCGHLAGSRGPTMPALMPTSGGNMSLVPRGSLWHAPRTYFYFLFLFFIIIIIIISSSSSSPLSSHLLTCPHLTREKERTTSGGGRGGMLRSFQERQKGRKSVGGRLTDDVDEKKKKKKRGKGGVCVGVFRGTRWWLRPVPEPDHPAEFFRFSEPRIPVFFCSHGQMTSRSRDYDVIIP